MGGGGGGWRSARGRERGQECIYRYHSNSKVNVVFVDAHAATCPASVRISRPIFPRSSTCVCVSSVVFLYCWSLVESGANRRQSPAATTQTEVLRRRGGGAQSVRVPDGGWLATADVFCRMYCADRHKKHAAGDGVRDQTSPYVAGSRRSFQTPRSIPRAVDPLRGHIPHSRGICISTGRPCSCLEATGTRYL